MHKNIVVITLSIFVLTGFSAESYANKQPPATTKPEQKMEKKTESASVSDEKANTATSAGTTSVQTGTETTKIIRQKPPTEIFSPSNTLGVTYAENMINKSKFYLGEKDYESTAASLNTILKWIEDATEMHTELYQTLNKLENSEVQANIERELAIKFAVLRDRALLLKAKLDIANKNKQKAVESLVEVVRSQPSTDIGFEAYSLLQKLGFTYKAEYETVEAPVNTAAPSK